MSWPMFSSTIFRVTNDKGEKHLTYRLQLEPLLHAGELDIAGCLLAFPYTAI